MPYVTEQNLTDVGLDRWKNIPDPRLRQVMGSLIKHLHGFVRDIEPTEKEWAAAIDFLTRIGKMCDDKRQEFILFSDVMGVSMLVDSLNHRLASGATPTTVEGPFHVANAPEVADGGNMAKGAPGVPCFVVGKVRDLDGKAVGGAVDARALQDAAGRLLRDPHRRADRLHHSDGRPGRRAREKDQHLTDA